VPPLVCFDPLLVLHFPPVPRSLLHGVLKRSCLFFPPRFIICPLALTPIFSRLRTRGEDIPLAKRTPSRAVFVDEPRRVQPCSPRPKRGWLQSQSGSVPFFILISPSSGRQKVFLLSGGLALVFFQYTLTFFSPCFRLMVQSPPPQSATQGFGSIFIWGSRFFLFFFIAGVSSVRFRHLFFFPNKPPPPPVRYHKFLAHRALQYPAPQSNRFPTKTFRVTEVYLEFSVFFFFLSTPPSFCLYLCQSLTNEAEASPNLAVPPFFHSRLCSSLF